MQSLSDCRKTCPVMGAGGKDSVKGNRQGFLSRFIRAQTNPLHRLCVPPGTKKKKTPQGSSA